MLIFPVLFLILLIWGLKDNDIYWGEAVFWTLAFLVSFGCFLLWRPAAIVCVVAMLIIDAVLLLRVVGSDVPAF